MTAQPASFANVFITPRVRAALGRVVNADGARKFWELVDKLRTNRFIPGLNVEKLHTRRGQVYSARLNIEMRVIYTIAAENEDRNLVILDLDHHDDAYSRVDRMQLSPSLLAAMELVDDSTQEVSQAADDIEAGQDITRGMMLFHVPYYVLESPDKFVSFERSIDRYLKLSDEQEDLLGRLDRAFCVQGSAGTGKTTLALFFALNLYESNPADEVFLFTYHDELACVCRAYKENLAGEEEPESGGIKVFSYLDFCKRYLRAQLGEKMGARRFIDRGQSIEIISSIIASRPRWRVFSAAEVWSFTYSILKGRFVPGTQRLPGNTDDFMKIFKDYGRTPENLDELLEIFEQYEDRLSKQNLLDEADMIRMSYESLIQKAILSADRKVWIVIDEIQDFTELEWKSILLFWENQCRLSDTALSFPFLSGDVNQNISRSGFRWQEVNGYLHKTLKHFHRPRSLVKVQLHQNYRNTREIFDLAVFVRELSGEQTSDLGLPPAHHGVKPQIVVGQESQLGNFLGNLAPDGGPPLVTLVEAHDSLLKLRDCSSDSAFVLPLSASKGMEFEDVVLARLFSSVQGVTEKRDFSSERLFDLWYMGVTRARRSLLVFLTPEDLDALKVLLGERFSKFESLVDFVELNALADFHRNREQHIPNYNVIFLERRIARDLWQQYLNYIAGAEESCDTTSCQAERYAEQAIRLFERCRDYVSLGKAYLELGRYHEAIPYLRRADMQEELAYCFVLTQEFLEAAAIYEKLRLWQDAARSYECAGEFHKAAQIYEKLESWLLAAENYSSAQDFAAAAESCEKGGMFRSAADIHRFRGNHLKAAGLYVRVEDWASAAEMYLRVKDKLDAARCFAKAGVFDRAARLLESLNRWQEAAQCHESGGHFKKAAQFFAKAGDLLPAARNYEQCGELSEAAALYDRARDFARAARLYLEAGKPALAAASMEKDGQWESALALYREQDDMKGQARCFEQLGNLSEAAEHFARSGNFKEAAWCYERASMWAQAAEYYLKDSSYGSAAPMLAKMGRRQDAARLYLLAGQVAQAVEQFKHDSQGLEQLLAWTVESERHDLQAQMLEYRKEYVKAAKLFEQCMMLSRAAEVYEKGRNFAEAAKLFQRDGNMTRAAECFKMAQQFAEAANCFEKLKRWQDAANMYERAGDADSAARCRAAVKWF